MEYQVSLEGHVDEKHAQLDFIDVQNYTRAITEAKTRNNLLDDPAEEYIALLFNNKTHATEDGIPADEIETLREGSNPLFRYKAIIL
jgi:hypothetical protein